MESPGCVVVFTKPAVAGRVKTRLIGALSAEQAAELHQAFLEDITGALAGNGCDLWIAWALEDDEEPPAAAWPAIRQRGETLGDRLFDGLAKAADQYRRVAAVGSDHPEMPPERVGEAFELLEKGADVALGPASDGGYYLIALRGEAVARELFHEIPWSTPAVLEETLARVESLGLELALLPEGHDVDTPADLERLESHLAASTTGCPNTRALLTAWQARETP